MTVGELIDKLGEFDPQAKVTVRGELFDWTEHVAVYPGAMNAAVRIEASA